MRLLQLDSRVACVVGRVRVRPGHRRPAKVPSGRAVGTGTVLGLLVLVGRQPGLRPDALERRHALSQIVAEGNGVHFEGGARMPVLVLEVTGGDPAPDNHRVALAQARRRVLGQLPVGEDGQEISARVDPLAGDAVHPARGPGFRNFAASPGA